MSTVPPVSIVPPASRPLARRAALAGMALLALALASCSDADYPSLAARPAERITQSISVAPAPAPLATPDTDTADIPTRAAQLVSAAEEAHKTFLAHQAETERAITDAAGGEVAGEAWSLATQALSRLIATRGPTVASLAALERLNADDRLAHAIADGESGNPLARSDAAAIDSARQTVLALEGEEDSTLARLQARLPD